MLAFPLRASARYPGGFDSQKLETVRRVRQTTPMNSSPSLWTSLGTPWGKRGESVWTTRGDPCGNPEDDAQKGHFPGGKRIPQVVDEKKVNGP